jgi:hypothetical protein
MNTRTRLLVPAAARLLAVGGCSRRHTATQHPMSPSRTAAWPRPNSSTTVMKYSHLNNIKEIFGSHLKSIRHIGPHKLVYLAETAVGPGSAAQNQIANLFDGLSAYHLAGLIWFDYLGRLDQTGKHKDFRLQQRPDDAALYDKMLSRFLR